MPQVKPQQSRINYFISVGRAAICYYTITLISGVREGSYLRRLLPQGDVVSSSSVESRQEVWATKLKSFKSHKHWLRVFERSCESWWENSSSKQWADIQDTVCLWVCVCSCEYLYVRGSNRQPPRVFTNQRRNEEMICPYCSSSRYRFLSIIPKLIIRLLFSFLVVGK